MPTFIDESGDTSSHGDAKPYFRLAAVWLPSTNATEEFDVAFRRIRAEQKWAAKFECKYSKTGPFPERRQAVFSAARECGFRFAASAVAKRRFDWRQPIDLYYVTAMSIAGTLRPLLIDAQERHGRPTADKLTVDKNDDRVFLAAVEYAFHRLRSPFHPNRPLTQKPVFKKSFGDSMLQLADLVCGAVGDHIDGNSEWFNAIRSAGIGPCFGDGEGVTCWP